MAIVTLLTDFGLSDTYVAQVKGVILSIAPSVAIVDLSHSVAPQDVRAGAYLLWTAVGAFPPGTVHLAVVDPGVGSSRRAVAMRTPTGHYLVGPDNGLLMPSAERLGGISRAVELQTPRGASTTFHGRDVFAPAAARLANGTALDQLGPPTENFVPGSLPKPEDDSGEIIHVDTYGNLVTNFAARDISGAYALELGDRVIPLKRYYAEVAPGELLALVGSAGFVEISVRDGDAAKVTGAGSGRRVRLVSRQPPPG